MLFPTILVNRLVGVGNMAKKKTPENNISRAQPRGGHRNKLAFLTDPEIYPSGGKNFCHFVNLDQFVVHRNHVTPKIVSQSSQ